VKLKPLNNHVILEIVDEYAGIVRNQDNEQGKKGILLDFAVSPLHITASSVGVISTESVGSITRELEALKGQTVYYQEYSDSGKKLKIDGKDYVQVYFWQLTSIEVPTKESK
jgi:co-chaperonin GroES (HSP10)